MIPIKIHKIEDKCYFQNPCKHYITYDSELGGVIIILTTSIEIYQICKKLNYPIPQHIKEQFEENEKLKNNKIEQIEKNLVNKKCEIL